MPNNNFMSAPDAMEVLTPYAASIKNLKITALKETSPATSAHEVGTYLTYNNVIYSVKSAIAVGDTLTVDTNIEVADIPEGAVVYWEDDSSPSGQVQSDWNQTDNTQPDYIKNKPSDDVVTLNGNPLSFTTDSEQAARECVITFEPIQAGTGDPSPSNIRAISGYDKVIIDINLWDTTFSEWEKYLTSDGTEVELNGFCISNYIEVEPNCNYKYYIPSGITSNAPAICWYDENKTYIGGEATSNRNEITVTTPSNAKYIRFSVYQANINYRLYKLPLIFSYNESLPETVYGGTLNVETGELVVDTAIKKFTSSDAWVKGSLLDGTQRFLHIVSPTMKTPDNGVYGIPNIKACNILKITDAEKIENYEVRNLVNSRIDVGLPESLGINTIEKMAQWAVDNNLEVVYPLATPYTIHLTPAQVRLLQGNNVVTTNGTSIKLTYRNGEVASLADVSSVAESVNALGEKVSNITEKVEKLKGGTFTANLSVGDNIMNTADGSATSIVTAGTIPPYPEYCLYIVDSISANNNATFSIHMDGGGTHKIIHIVTNTAQTVRVRWWRIGI